MFTVMADREHPESSRRCERGKQPRLQPSLLTFLSVQCFLRLAVDNRHLQPSRVNKSCVDAPWQKPGSGKVSALSSARPRCV